MNALIGRKLGMTRIFADDGAHVPVTVIEAGPCPVVQVAGDRVQLGFETKKAKRTVKAMAGHVKAAALSGVPRRLESFPFTGEAPKPGDQVTVSIFAAGELVKVSGVTKGRGFTGVVKRWGMKGAARDSSTSHEHHRHPGAIGQRKTPGKVWKGKHLPGQMGVDQVTVQNLFVAGIEAEQNLLLVSGAVPGHADGLLFVNTAAKGQPRMKKKQEEKRAKPKA